MVRLRGFDGDVPAFSSKIGIYYAFL